MRVLAGGLPGGSACFISWRTIAPWVETPIRREGCSAAQRRNAARPRVRVASQDLGRAKRFAQRESKRHGIPVEPVATVREAVLGADIVCTTTSSREPVVSGEWLSAGVHVNAVGSSVPSARELDAAMARGTLTDAQVLVRLHPRDEVAAYREFEGVPHIIIEKPFRDSVTVADGLAIGALPLIMKSARAAMEEVDPRLVAAARSLGAPPLRAFITITLPLARTGIVAGLALGFARALGDFGVTLMVAGNIPGVTRTAALAIYDMVQANREQDALGTALVLTGLSIVALYLVNRSSRGALRG